MSKGILYMNKVLLIGKTNIIIIYNCWLLNNFFKNYEW